MLRVLLIILIAAFVFAANAQTVVDKTMATVSDGVGDSELITYSDLLWQLALQPGAEIRTPAFSAINQTLETVISQRLILIEAKRLPGAAPTKEEIKKQVDEILSRFGSTQEFVSRLNRVGFKSIEDENFVRLMSERLVIEKYINFRFRSFVVVTPEEEAGFYRDTFVPDFRKRFPGVIIPTLEQQREKINQNLTEDKVAADIEQFLDEARRRAEIVYLSDIGGQ